MMEVEERFRSPSSFLIPESKNDDGMEWTCQCTVASAICQWQFRSSMMRCVICYVAPESGSYEDCSEKLALFIIDLSLSPP